MPSVCILSAAWRRYSVTRLVLAQRARLADELAARGVDADNLIVADDANLDIAREYGAVTLNAPNQPLGVKCNIGLRRAADMADFVCWIGSDDWIHPDVFDPLLTRRQSPVLITGRRLAIVNMKTGRMQRISSPSKFGAIPWLIDSRLLRTDRPPIQADLRRGLDGALVRGIRLARIPFGFLWHDPHEFRCVDFKTSENITPYGGLAKNLGVGDEDADPWGTLAHWFPADLVEQARTLAG